MTTFERKLTRRYFHYAVHGRDVWETKEVTLETAIKLYADSISEPYLRFINSEYNRLLEKEVYCRKVLVEEFSGRTLDVSDGTNCEHEKLIVLDV